MATIKPKFRNGNLHPKTNSHQHRIEKMVETNDQWIVERTGIKERRICSPDGANFPDMAYHATQQP